MPGTSEAVRLIELTSARLCQDIGMLSGVAQRALDDDGAEALQGGPSNGQPRQPAALPRNGSPGQAPDLLVWRSKLRQAAWGLDEHPLRYDELLLLAAGLPTGVSIDLAGLEDNCVFPMRIGRIVLNLMLLAAESLPSGGTVMLAGSADDLFLRIVGPAAAWPAGMAACVVDEAAACAAMAGQHGVQMPLTALLAHASGVRLSFLLASQVMPPILRLGGG